MPNPKHKKTFILVNSSSAPWGDKQVGSQNKVDLAQFDFPEVDGPVDGLRVGMNAVGANQAHRPGAYPFEYGIYTANRAKNPEANAQYLYQSDQRGLGFTVGRFVSDKWTPYRTVNSPTSPTLWPNDTTDGYAFGEPALVQPRNATSITEFWKTKQEFFISTPIGPNGLQNLADVPTAPDYWTSSGSWGHLIREFFQNKTYYDLSLTMDWPYYRDEFTQEYAAYVHEPFVSIKPSYNFYVRQYEEGIQKYDADNFAAPLPSYMLPNVYMFVAERDESFLDPSNRPSGYAHSNKFYKHITLKDRIPTTYKDILLRDDQGLIVKKIGEEDTGQHFEKFGKVINRQGSVNSIGPVNTSLADGGFNEYQNLIFPRDNLTLLDNMESETVFFPMNVEVEFATDNNTAFSDFLRDAKLTSVLTKWIIDSEPDAGFKDWAQYAFNEDPATIHSNARPLLGTANEDRFNSLTSSWQSPDVYDFGSFVNNILYTQTGLDADTLSDDWQTILDPNFSGTFMGKHREEILAATDSSYAIFTQLMMYVFKDSAKGFMEDHQRSFAELFNIFYRGPEPKFAYSETLLYCLEKTALTASGVDSYSPTSDVQKIWFPNSSDIDIIKYMDTQVKYNTPYEYVLNAYQLVIGNKYEYKINIHSQPLGGGIEGGSADEQLWQQLCLFNEPCLKLIKIPIYNSTWDSRSGILVNDSPPIPPDIHIIPYRGIDDKLLIWFNGNVGDVEDYPVKIFDDDYPLDFPLDKKIRFKSDDPSTQFEVFRLDKRPTSYRDFAAGKHKVVGGAGGPTKSYTDTEIIPNRKYYYTFRTTDVHGKKSNPTVVYECELVKVDEFVHAEIRVIDMNDLTDLQIVKPFKKFLQIKPAYSQTILDTTRLKEWAETYNGVTDMETIKNGTQMPINFQNPGASLWNTGNGIGKKYKIRLHSKKSGRKIDFNIDYTFDTSVQFRLDGEDES